MVGFVIRGRKAKNKERRLIMKKFVVCLLLCSMLSSTAWAKPFHHHRPPVWHHRPAPVVVHRAHHIRIGDPVVAIASGLIGFVAGSAVASANQPVYSVNMTEDKQCFAVVSKSNGTVTQHCVSGDNQVLYVD